ncbi:hypothetical protein [Dyadobacter tibetensis]|uniref:hypothetical protein n=1 Tax=Dyadobacter tibetensis TaxID=1211851 RepID=UPI00047002E6|nr:hypothetical protein [Dyadobacter tibetensis]
MKIARYFFLGFFIIVWAIGTSTDLSTLAAKAGLVNDSYRYGDLYRLSNLRQFRDPKLPCPSYRPFKEYGADKPVHLYIIGDSFTEADRIGKENFAADYYHYTHWSQTLHFKPDTSVINVLLLESVERHFREKFTNQPLANLVVDSTSFNEAYPNPLMVQVDDLFRSSVTESRLDQLLFQNDFFLRLKELKAGFNLFLFDRTTPEVTLINEGNNIVYYMDTDTPNLTSSFTELPQTSLDSIVLNLNHTKSLVENMGFDHVFLSVIPNKVSVLMPNYGNYNRLIERTITHPQLRLETIDVLNDFRNQKNSPYLKGDSHWTCAGQKIWVDKANAKIKEMVSRKRIGM